MDELKSAAQEGKLAAARRVASLPPAPTPHAISLERYRSIAARVVAPTPTQIDAFVDYVSNAHSWYKHLPWTPPGVPFTVFIDPGAGMDRVITEEGRLAVAPRFVRGFHHSALPTDVYRQRFGFPAYSQSSATQGVEISEAGVRRSIGDNVTQVYDAETGQVLGLPPGEPTAGVVWLSSLVQWWTVVEPMFLKLDVSRFVRNGNPPSRLADFVPAWPAESGGRERLLAILERAAVLTSKKEAHCPMTDEQTAGKPVALDSDAVMFELLAPERLRQISSLRAACVRVCDWVGCATV